MGEREVTERRHLQEEALLDRRRRDLESAIDATVPKTMMGPDAPTREACDREYTQDVVSLAEAVLLNILAPEHRGLSSGKTHRKGDTAWSKGKFARQVKIEHRAHGWDKERRDGCGNKSKAGTNKTCGDIVARDSRRLLGLAFKRTGSPETQETLETCTVRTRLTANPAVHVTVSSSSRAPSEIPNANTSSSSDQFQQ